MELSYNREAKRTRKAAESSLFGPMNQAQKKTSREILENICMMSIALVLGRVYPSLIPLPIFPRQQKRIHTFIAHWMVHSAFCQKEHVR